MPVNKNAKFRFDIIDECLRSTTKKWSKAALLQYINRRLELHYGTDTHISASQLRYDLEHMQSEFGAPIEMYRDGRNYYYRYEDAGFSIKNIPLKEQDIATLKQAIGVLQSIEAMPLAAEVTAIVRRLEGRYYERDGEGSN